MDVGEFNGDRLYTVHRLDYRLRLWAPTSASCTVSAVAELLVCKCGHVGLYNMQGAHFQCGRCCENC